MERPIYDSLRQLAGRGYHSWHMPGHKGGRLFSLDSLYELDVTELEGTDNLQRPTGIIREAEQRMAAFFGADESFFSVNGQQEGSWRRLRRCAALAMGSSPAATRIKAFSTPVFMLGCSPSMFNLKS